MYFTDIFITFPKANPEFNINKWWQTWTYKRLLEQCRSIMLSYFLMQATISLQMIWIQFKLSQTKMCIVSYLCTWESQGVMLHKLTSEVKNCWFSLFLTPVPHCLTSWEAMFANTPNISSDSLQSSRANWPWTEPITK